MTKEQARDAALTRKQAQFVAEYLVDLNATQAAIRAGYSRRTAQEQSSRLLSKAIVAHAVAARQRKSIEKLEASADDVLKELACIALLDARSFFDDDGNLKPIKDLSAAQGAALSSFEILIKNAAAGDGKTDLIHKLRFWDKPKALELLAKRHGLLVERVDVNGTIELAWRSSE